MLLYIHVAVLPQSLQLCAFHSMAIGGDGSGAQMMSDYLDTLLLELAHYGDKLGKAPVSSVFSAAARQAYCRPILWGAFWEKD